MMFKGFSHRPIYQRLFLAFFLAGLIPDLIIVFMSLFYTRVLLARGMNASEIGPMTTGTILALLASTAVVMVLGYLVNRTITQPLRYLAVVAKRIRQGDTRARAAISGRDEIAIVAASINSMLDQIVRFITETQGQRDYLQGQVEQLIAEVSGVGQGDLSIQAEVTHEALGVLADSFNYMVEALSDLVIRVKQVTFEVENATNTTGRDMVFLVTAADQQLQQISRTVRTIDAMVQACHQVASRTQILDQKAKEAKLAAQQGRQKVQETLEGIEQIHRNALQTASQIQLLGERSQEIEEIISVLENIVHHTNRLALDAAIQVAMVGNANAAGFGPVAEGIRRLAEQTKQGLTTAARTVKSVRTEIMTVAESIQEAERENATGAARIQTTGTLLSMIFDIIEQQASEVGTINHMTEQLLGSSREMSATMNTIASTTKDSSNRTSMVAKNMMNISMLVKQLRISVEVFKVKKQTVQPVSHKDEQWETSKKK